jgi:L-lactate dehydrogenase complex protein LldE
LKIGLFIPCYIDQFYPNVGISTLAILEKLGHEVEYPENQTCCGQPMANAGYASLTSNLNKLFDKNFSDFDAVVAPSGSCVLHIHEHSEVKDSLKIKTWELCSFLDHHHKPEDLISVFPHRVALHQSCHGLRGLRLASSSELVIEPFSIVEKWLNRVDGLQLVKLNRADECCGFGGTFAVQEESVSICMGNDRLKDFLNHNTEVVTATDMSCLMHLEGLAKRQKLQLRFKHIAEILSVNIKVNK